MNLPVYNGTIFSSFFTGQNLTPNCKQNPWFFLHLLPQSRIGRMLFEHHKKQSICFSFIGVCVAILSYGQVTKISRDDGLFSEPTTGVNGNDP